MSIADGSLSSRPWWNRRWPWILAVGIVAAMVWIPFSIRSRGLAHYDAAKARMAAAGMGGGLDEFKRDAPVADPNIQARWRSVVLRAGSCARVIEYYGEAETALREGRALPSAPDAADSAGRLAGVMHAHLQSIASTALMARQRHRMARAFVRALKAPVEGVLPPVGPAELPIVVERMGADRLCLRVDADGSLPPAWEWIALPMPPPDPAGPPKPFVWGQGFVEADLRPAPR